MRSLAGQLVVVILNWNSAADLQRCLASLGAVDGLDVLVVDNDSSTADQERLRLLSQQYGFRLLQSGANRGYAGGMNVGLRWARASGRSHALLLNPDTLPTADLVHGLWAHRRDAAVVGVPQTSDMVGTGSPDDGYTSAANLSGSKLVPFACPGCDQGLHHVDIVTGACLLVDLAAAESVGFFDESYFHYQEEVDLCVRLGRHGHRIAFWCGGLLRHRRGGSLDTRSPLATYYSVRNELLFTRRLFGWPAVLRMRRLPFEALRTIVRSPRSPQARAVRSAVVDGLRMVDGPSLRSFGSR